MRYQGQGYESEVTLFNGGTGTVLPVTLLSFDRAWTIGSEAPYADLCHGDVIFDEPFSSS